jgi:N-acetyl-alpha-D-glucosaminyl L-malate synthase BshA
MERHGIEIVHAHYAIPHATSAILARDAGLPIKVVTTLHGTDVTMVGVDPAYRYTTRHAIAKSDAVTAVSPSLVQAARETLGVTRDIAVIPNWVDCNRFVANTDATVRARYAQPDELLLIHVSNFRPVKQVDAVLKVFSAILARIPARLFLVGDGPEKQKCIDLAVELGVSGRMLSLPSMPDVEKILGIADFLLLPSLSEAFPLVALEGMSSGTVVVASNVGGIPLMIEHGRTGFLFEPDDHDGMARTIIDLVQNKERWATIRLAAREEAVNRYQLEHIIPSYLDLYGHLLS